MFIFSVAYIKKWNEVVWILPILAPVEFTIYLHLPRKYYVAAVSSKRSSWKARNPGNEDRSYDLSFDYPRLIETSTKKTGFFGVPKILREIKGKVIIGESLLLMNKREWNENMVGMYGTIYRFFTILLRVFVFLHPRSSALILGPRPPSRRPSAPEYCKTKYNTTI